MTAPQFARCRCGHAKVAHERGGLAPQCIADRCTCLNYRPDVPLASPNALPPRPGSLESILQDAKRSQHKRTVALAEKITAEVNDLRGRLTAERAAAEQARLDEAHKAEAQQKIAALEKQLAEARALLRGGKDSGKDSGNAPSPGATLSINGERLPCTQTGCDRTFSKQQGLSRHLNETHGITRQQAAS